METSRVSKRWYDVRLMQYRLSAEDGASWCMAQKYEIAIVSVCGASSCSASLK